MSSQNLPPLPRYLRETFGMSFSQNKTNNANENGPKSLHKNIKKRSVSPKPSHGKTKLERQIDLMRNEMMKIREMDKALLEEFYALHANIQEYKQVQEKMLDTTLEYSTGSYSFDLDTFEEVKEPIYANEKFHSHIYENVPSKMHESRHQEKSKVHEPMYLQPQCHSKPREKNHMSPVTNLSNTSSVRNIDPPGSQANTVPAVRKSSGQKSKKQSSKRLSGVFSKTTYESSC